MKPLRIVFALALPGALALISGCASQSAVGLAYEEGRRSARVEQVEPQAVSSAMASRQVRSCPGAEVPGRMVVVSHAFGANPNLRQRLAVQMPLSLALSVGDRVRVHLATCQLAASPKA